MEFVQVERRVSPPPRHRATFTFRPSFATQMTQETGKRYNGAAAAILAVRPPQSPRHNYCGGIPRLGEAAAATSYPMFARHSRQFPTENRAARGFEGQRFWRPRASGPPRSSSVKFAVSHTPTGTGPFSVHSLSFTTASSRLQSITALPRAGDGKLYRRYKKLENYYHLETRIPFMEHDTLYGHVVHHRGAAGGAAGTTRDRHANILSCAIVTCARARRSRARLFGSRRPRQIAMCAWELISPLEKQEKDYADTR